MSDEKKCRVNYEIDPQQESIRIKASNIRTIVLPNVKAKSIVSAGKNQVHFFWLFGVNITNAIGQDTEINILGDENRFTSHASCCCWYLQGDRASGNLLADYNDGIFRTSGSEFFVKGRMCRYRIMGTSNQITYEDGLMYVCFDNPGNALIYQPEASHSSRQIILSGTPALQLDIWYRIDNNGLREASYEEAQECRKRLRHICMRVGKGAFED